MTWARKNILLLAGLSLMWLWIYRAWDPLNLAAEERAPFILVGHLASALLVLLLALVSRFLTIDSKLLIVAGGTAGATGTFFSALLSVHNPPTSMLIGIAYALMLSAWMRQLAQEHFRDMIRSICGSWLILAILYAAFYFLPQPIDYAIQIVAPLGSLAVFIIRARLASNASIEVRDDDESGQSTPEVDNTLRQFIPTILSTLLYAFSLGLITQLIGIVSSLSWISGAFGVALFFLLYEIVMKKNALPRVIMIVTALIACVTILLVLFLTVNNIFLLAVAMMAFWSLFLLVLTHSCSKGAGNTRRNLFLQYFWMGSYLLVFTLGKASFWFAFIDDTVALVLAAVMLVGAALLTSFSREPNEYPQVGNTLLPTLSGDFSSRIEYIATRNAITDREKDVLCLLAKGYSLKKIASQLMISQSTAKTHRHSIYLKLSVSSRQELIDFVETES